MHPRLSYANLTKWLGLEFFFFFVLNLSALASFVARLRGLKLLGLLHNGLLDATDSGLREDGAIKRSEGGASGAFVELGVWTFDDEAPCD